jgi:hypothetical protein
VSIDSVTRRLAVFQLGAFAVASVTGLRHAPAQTVVRFRDIRVDVWPLRASAGDEVADWVEDELPKDLAQALAPYMAPAGRDSAILLARIDNIDFSGAGWGRGSSGSVDSMDGVLIVSGLRAGAAQMHLRAIASYSSSAVDQPMFEEAYHGRVATLAKAFAGSTPRQLGV